jgi:transcriptional regulator with XRE-family HTH domain
MAAVSSEPGFPGELSKSGDGRGRTWLQDVDRHIGARIRQRRLALGIGLPRLAELVGVTAQQAYKYEKGINRVSAGRLFVIAQALAADVGFFFQGLDDVREFDVTPQGRLLLEFVRNFMSLNEQCHQAALSSLVRALADRGARDISAARQAKKNG